MGKTFSTGLLTNGVFQDSSNNIGIGGAANASYKLQVTGTTNLTGVLSGTSATFSGNLKVRGGTAFGGYYMDYQSDAASRSFRVSSEHLVFGDFVIQRSTTRTGTTYEDLLYFNASRAATFSSSVTAAGLITGQSSIYQTNAAGSIASNRFETYNGGATEMTFIYPASGAVAFNNGSERMRITSGGEVQVRQSNDNFGFGLALRNIAGNRWQIINGGDNNLYFGNEGTNKGVINVGTGSYIALSDINKKKDFEDSTIGLNAILGLKPTLYRMNEEDELCEKSLGFIAQEVKEFIPQAYFESGNEDNKFIGLQDRPIIAALVKAIQELKAEIDELKNK